MLMVNKTTQFKKGKSDSNAKACKTSKKSKAPKARSMPKNECLFCKENGQ